MKKETLLSRRDFIKIATLLGSSAFLESCGIQISSSTDRVPSPSSPNIILILTDDQPPGTIDLMPILQDKIVANGVNFSSNFCTTPLCSPSRASILTGQYAHNHGVLKNRYPDGGAEAFDDTSTIATWLHSAGYRTSYIGKYLNGYNDLKDGYIPPGWDDWHVFVSGKTEHRLYYDYTMSENGKVVTYEGSDYYGTDLLAEKALDFIRQSKDQAFFLLLSFYAPHQPRTAAQRHQNFFKTDEQISPWRPPNFNEDDVSDKPAWVDVEKVDPNQMDKAYQKAMRSLMSVDEAVSDLLDVLQDIRQIDNTAIIYYSDNGEAWGEHRLSEAKNCPYDACSRVPFILSYPKVVESQRVDNRLVANIDLAPTIADIAGVAYPAWVDGVSVLPVLKDASTEWRDSILIEHWPTDEGHGSTIPEFSAIRTLKWKYVEYETGEKELYDLVNDPYEMESLANQEQYNELMVELAIELERLKNQ